MSDVQSLFDALERRDSGYVAAQIASSPALANEVNEYRQSVFFLACLYGLKDLVEFMLKEPVLSILDYDLPDYGGRDALDAAEAYKHKEIIKLLEPVFGVNEFPVIAQGTAKVALSDLFVHYARGFHLTFQQPFNVRPLAGFAVAITFGAFVTLFAMQFFNGWGGSEEPRMIAYDGSGESLRPAIISALKQRGPTYEHETRLFNRMRENGLSEIVLERRTEFDSDGEQVNFCTVDFVLNERESKLEIAVKSEPELRDVEIIHRIPRLLDDDSDKNIKILSSIVAVCF